MLQILIDNPTAKARELLLLAVAQNGFASMATAMERELRLANGDGHQP